MSDQSTRATDTQADPRQPFTLGQEDAQALYGVAQKGEAATNAWWLEAGQRLGFVWTTVGDLHWNATPRDDMGETQAQDVKGATFTAWPTPLPITPDDDADAYVARQAEHRQQEGLGEPFDWESSDVAAAFVAGRDMGFAMGSATAQANRPGLGWDGMILIRESAELLRSYESNHLAKVPAWREIVEANVSTDSVAAAQAAIADTMAKAERNATQAAKLESFLADPTQSHLVHDGLREARDDSATAALAGWHAAMLQVRDLVESGAWWRGETLPGGIPPLVLLDRLAELPPPEDMDEVFERLRNPMLQVERLRVALREWLDKSEWVREAVKIGVPKSLGMPPQWGRHYMDTARDMVARLNTLLAEAIAGTLAGLHVQAAADVLQAMGITGKRADRVVVDDPQPVPGVYSPDQGSTSFTRRPLAEGLECMGPLVLAHDFTGTAGISMGRDMTIKPAEPKGERHYRDGMPD